MEFNRNRQRASQRKISSNVSDYSKSPMFFYTTPPEGIISLHEFEDIAVQRLKVLKCIDDFHIKWRTDENHDGKKLSNQKQTEDRLESLERELRELQRKEKLDILSCILLKGGNTMDNNNTGQLDYISHFILRLVYCKTAELKKWFLSQEVDLFSLRFQIILSRNQRAEFIKANNLNYTPIEKSEQQQLKEYLLSATANISAVMFDDMQFYKIPFEDVLDLVKSRRVYLRGGFAYIPEYELSTLIVAAFRAHLSHQLSITARILPHLEEDHRLLPLLSGLSRRYLGQNYGVTTNEDNSIKAESIDSLAKTSFPLCMKNMHYQLKTNHHLKNMARLQYGLFLKGIGMPLEESMRMWKIEFTKNPNIDADKFDKQYAYAVRYQYGKEGKRANYNPHSCIKVIMSNQPGPGENHGCPFKHYQPDVVKKQLVKEGIPTSGVDKIMNLVDGGHYQMACSYYFGSTHAEHMRNVGMKQQDKPIIIEHPNQYFLESQKLIKGERIATVNEEEMTDDATGSSDTQATGTSDVSQQPQRSLCDEPNGFTQEELTRALEDMEEDEDFSNSCS